jgi:RNA polymerase sigma-70 factor, ECF subfamily
MPFRRPSRPTPHADDARRRRNDDAPDPTGEPLPDDLDDSTEVVENEELTDSEDATETDPVADDEDGTEDAQRFAESGVKEDMGTAAIHPQSRVSPHVSPHEPVSGSPTLPPGGWSQLSDAEVMLRVAAGDEAGFGLLVEKYRRQMVHYMFRMVHNQAIAEELAQEVFLRVYRARASYRAEAKFSTWLYRIATNLGVNHARDTRHERGAQTVYLDQPDPETGISPDVADSTPSVEQDMLREARLAAIRKHVMALPERQRTAVLMHKYQDLDYKQIGAVLKLSESATKSLLFRAYQTLRERLQEFI